MYCILSTHQGAHTECKQPALYPSSASLPGLQASSLTASKLLTGAAEKAARSHCFSLQVADRLFSSFGQDILDALYWTATEPKERKRAHIGVIPHFFMAVLYVCILLGLEGTPATVLLCLPVPAQNGVCVWRGPWYSITRVTKETNSRLTSMFTFKTLNYYNTDVYLSVVFIICHSFFCF